MPKITAELVERMRVPSSVRRQVDRGEDPALAKKEARTAPTVRDLIDRYYRDVIPGRQLNPKRRRAVDRVLAVIAAGLGERRRVVDVHFGDVEHLHRKVTESGGPVAANRLVGLCSVLFSLSLKPLPGETKPWRDAVLGNPCKGIKKNVEHGRERFFSAAELAAISDALAEYAGGSSAAADCIRLCMLTGCRPGSEAMKARWAEFDEPGHWNKPSSHTKQRRTHRVPLNAAALELIDRLRKRRGSSDFVFPGPDGSGLSDVSRCWEWVRDRAGLGKTARLYDLRHSFASVGAGGGLSLLIVGKLLGHSQARTTSRYAHFGQRRAQGGHRQDRRGARRRERQRRQRHVDPEAVMNKPPRKLMLDLQMHRDLTPEEERALDELCPEETSAQRRQREAAERDADLQWVQVPVDPALDPEGRVLSVMRTSYTDFAVVSMNDARKGKLDTLALRVMSGKEL